MGLDNESYEVGGGEHHLSQTRLAIIHILIRWVKTLRRIMAQLYIYIWICRDTNEPKWCDRFTSGRLKADAETRVLHSPGSDLICWQPSQLKTQEIMSLKTIIMIIITKNLHACSCSCSCFEFLHFFCHLTNNSSHPCSLQKCFLFQIEQNWHHINLIHLHRWPWLILIFPHPFFLNLFFIF